MGVFLVGLIVGLFIGASPASTPRTSSEPNTVTSLVTTTMQLTATTITNLQSPDILGACFSPGGNCADLVVYWIGRANSSIHIMIYSFTLENVGDALIQAKQRGVDVKIAWDESEMNVRGSEYQKLQNAGIPIHIDERPGLLHDKYAVIDSHIILTGSFNWSNAANQTNRENLIVLDSQEWGSAYEQNFQQNWQAT